MPIVDVEIVLRPGESIPEGLAALLAESAARALGAEPGRTWVKIRVIEPDHYAEDEAGSRMGVSPVFVYVLKSELPRGGGKIVEIHRLTEEVARLCGRPSENVHVIYLPAARGRLAFGGNLVSGSE